MAVQIRVSLDVLHQEADKIKIACEQSDKLNTRIKSIANKLDAAWDSLSSKDMVDKILILSNSLQLETKHLEESMLFLQEVAYQFEQIDAGKNDTAYFHVDFRDEIKILGPGSRPDFLQPLMLSSGTIRVVPDELREVANESKEIIDESVELINNLDKITNELQNSWEGRAYIRFSEKFNEIKIFYPSLIESLEEFYQRIIFVADRYDEIDNLFG